MLLMLCDVCYSVFVVCLGFGVKKRDGLRSRATAVEALVLC